MSTSFRNPFTPSDKETLTPIGFLERYLLFTKWNQENEVIHKPECLDKTHHIVMIHGMCCLPHLQQCIESNLLNLAGCKAGVFIEPKNYRKWLNLAEQRLLELNGGNDNLSKWKSILKIQSPNLYSWIWENQHIDENLQPNFSLESFKIACLKHGYNPNYAAVAKAFHCNEKEVAEYWSESVN